MSETIVPSDPQALAEAVAASMWSQDHASQAMGMLIVAVAPGRAELSMTVRHDILNGHGICHGGFIFTLADSAFAFACNSGNMNTVASGCSIDFLLPAREGDLLTAIAEERSASGRTGIYDVEVSNGRGERVALFRGKSYRIRGNVIASGLELPAVATGGASTDTALRPATPGAPMAASESAGAGRVDPLTAAAAASPPTAAR